MQIESLEQWGVIEVTGEDAPAFLHSQLTQDMQGLSPGRAVPAAYCTAKGRMLGQFVVLRDGGRYLLLTHREMADAQVKRLSMFVLRLKCQLQNVSRRFDVLGVKGELTDGLPVVGFPAQAADAIPQMAYEWRRHSPSDTDPATLTLIGWPASPIDHQPRYLVLREHAQAGQIVSTDVSSAAPQALTDAAPSASFWMADDIACGLPFLEPANLEAFVPQMVNLDVIGGVNFSKGCYPGQEVVARSHYLGKMKRRMQVGAIAAAAPAGVVAGADVFSTTHPGEPAGRIVNAVLDASGQTRVLFEISMDNLPGAVLRAGASDGPEITLQALPYALPAPNTPPGRS